MSNLRRVFLAMSGALVLAASPGVLSAEGEGEFFNAEVGSNGWCNYCIANVGHPYLCPCRIADPIIIK